MAKKKDVKIDEEEMEKTEEKEIAQSEDNGPTPYKGKQDRGRILTLKVKRVIDNWAEGAESRTFILEPVKDIKLSKMKLTLTETPEDGKRMVDGLGFTLDKGDQIEIQIMKAYLQTSLDIVGLDDDAKGQ